jgi:glyoxylate reductase
LRVCVTQALEAGAWKAFQATGWQLEQIIQPSRAQLAEILPRCDGLVSMLTDQLDAELLLSARGGPLKLIANHAVGYDNIDLATAHSLGILVSNTPGVLTAATAEFALTLMLNLLRRVNQGEQLVRTGNWKGWEPTQLLGSSLAGKNVGIVGAGRIGQALAKLVTLLGANVAYTSRSPKPEFEAELAAKYMSFEDLLKWSEILSLHLPGGASTRHLLNRQSLAIMQKGAYLINTGRGTSVDERALAEALQSGHLAGAALDVYEHEPLIHPDLLVCPHLILAPHLGSATIATRRAMAMTCLANLEAVFAGRPAPNQLKI